MVSTPQNTSTAERPCFHNDLLLKDFRHSKVRKHWLRTALDWTNLGVHQEDRPCCSNNKHLTVKVFPWPFIEADLHQWERFWLAKRIRGREHWVMLSYKRAENNSSLKRAYSTFQTVDPSKDLLRYLTWSSQKIFTFLLSTYNMLLFYHLTNLNIFVGFFFAVQTTVWKYFWFAATEFSCMWGVKFFNCIFDML